MAEAEAKEVNDPNAMSLATCTADGRPSVRVVILTGVDERGSSSTPTRQARRVGNCGTTPLPHYAFTGKACAAKCGWRGRASQIAVWTSKQSQVLGGRFELEKRIGEYAAKFGLGSVPGRPTAPASACARTHRILAGPFIPSV
jgi:pyridoxamine 5'-phosphate oxidase